MEMIGALGKSAKKASNVYFFTCSKKELDIKSIRQLIAQSGCTHTINLNGVEVVAIESNDELVSDRRLVGFIFKSTDGKTYESITLNEYPDLDEYMRFMITDD